MENKSFLIHYILNTSFHGVRYLAEPNRHWTERIFWFICCSVSWWFSGMVISSIWASFQNNAISFVVDTSYTEWNTDFPAVYVCELGSEDKIAEASDRIFGDPHDYNLDEIVRELAFYSEHYFFTMELCGPDGKGDVCYKNNFSALSLKARSSCTEIFRLCSWNQVDFDCCRFFVNIDTDVGGCFGLGSLQTSNFSLKDILQLPMVSNRQNGPGSLKLQLNGETNVYIMGPLEVPSVITSKKEFVHVQPHTKAQRTFIIKEIENQPEVRSLNIHQRKCRFADENYLNVCPFYSYSACLMQCRKDAQLKKCGCAHHLMPNTSSEKKCKYSGLACFQDNFQELMVQKPAGSEKIGLECNCLPSCTEIQLDVVNDMKIGFSEGYSILELSLEKLPTERYKRNVVKGPLDVAVSIGSATALFLGASFLSFIELFYYFFIRPVLDYLRTKLKSNR